MRLFLILGAALVLTSVPGQAQEPAPVRTVAVVTHFDVASEPSAQEQASALFDNLTELRRLQELHYAKHGQFAVSASDLPEFRTLKGAQIHTTSGGDWLTIQAHLPGVVAYGITLWPKGKKGIISGTFSDMSQLGQASKP